MTTAKPSNTLAVKTCGATIPLTAFEVKPSKDDLAKGVEATGRYWWSFYSAQPGGTKIAPLAGALPDRAMFVLDGDEYLVDLEPGVTVPRGKDGQPTGKPGNQKVSGSTKVEIDGKEKTVTVQFSALPSGQWNAILSVRGAGGGSKATVDHAVAGITFD